MLSKIKEVFLRQNRFTKQAIAISADMSSLYLSATIISMIFFVELELLTLPVIIIFPFFVIVVFVYFGVYRSVLRYINFSSINLILKAAVISYFLYGLFLVLSLTISSYFFDFEITKFTNLQNLQIFIVYFLLSNFFIMGIRILANSFFSQSAKHQRVAIYGAGSAGLQLAGALRVSKEIEPVAFIDKNSSLQGTYLGGMKVLSPMKLERLVRKGSIDEVLIAMPSASKSTLRSLLKEIENYSIKVRILPGLAELAQGKISVSELKEVDVSDLLGRTEVEARQILIDRNIDNKVVLVTGAGGSIGSEISRQVSKNRPKKVILLDSSEYALFSIKNEIKGLYPQINLYSILGNVTNKERISEICKAFKVETIYHAAAYKHVSLVEENPFEAVINNILGTKMCAEAAVDSNVETFVLISTDKAVRPTNIMGATKRFSELVLQSMSKDNKTKMIMVRFGNVIGSSGSAIPLFQKQIKDGGPITVTHPEVVRYFMSIPEAAELVIQAGAMGEGGDVFVLDMGEPVKIVELAKRLISLSGMELTDENNTNGDIEIVFTGLKPGEKLFEELLIGDNANHTEHERILKAQEEFIHKDLLDEYFIRLKAAQKEGNVHALKNILKEAISGFTPDEEIVDVLHLQKNN